MLALADESILQAGPGSYTLSCVCLPDPHRAAVRRRVRRITPARRQFHWVREEARERFAMLQLLAEEATHCFAYTRRPVAHRQHERARAVLVGALCADLREAGVLELIVESRQPHNDRRDRHAIAAAQLAGAASRDLDYRHTGAGQEPLLWLADALAGAVTAQLRGDGRYLAVLPAARLVLRPG